MQQQKPSLIIIATIIIMAIILAVGLFLTLLFIQNRGMGGGSTIAVEGVDVQVNMNPEDEVMIVTDPGQGSGPAVVPTAETFPVPTDIPPPPPPTETPIPPTALPLPDPIILINHQVSSGETLFSIANRYNTTIPLMARFAVSSANLMPGAVIQVAVANPAYCPGRRAYVIREGDTPFSVSQMAGISLEEFRQINGLTENSPFFFTNVVCIP
ncbi:MAG: LysM peptidoglycan-binding domain-containing protein [Chloroflexi bacterium]|nr:LysM peptidoglycan-binding domain-containing protein [Chloroflexota bacterium]